MLGKSYDKSVTGKFYGLIKEGKDIGFINGTTKESVEKKAKEKKKKIEGKVFKG